jgi:hypothetical protein
MNLLAPLSDATEILCASKYPTLNKALPVYIILIRHLHTARQGIYDGAQIIRPANEMIDKINQYLIDALKKPMYLCAMILNPRFKTAFWKNNKDFIVKHYNLSVDDIEKSFLDEAQTFETTHASGPPDSLSRPYAPSRSQDEGQFASALFQPAPEIQGIESEIVHYLKQDVETRDADVLSFWASHQKSFPKLALMARRYLSIPATSAASERVFSTGRRVVSWQRSSLKPSTVENLLCLKDWFQAFEGPL